MGFEVALLRTAHIIDEEAFQYAVNDLKTNFRAHHAFYLAH